jgi:hypothetical protein
MSDNDYMLALGANVYANPTYIVTYEIDKTTRDNIHLFTLENSNEGLILTAEVKDEAGNLVAKVDKNKLTLGDERIYVKGEIEKGPGLTLARKDDDTVILNTRITGDGYVAVTGTFHAGGKKIYIADDAVKIDDVNCQTIKGVNVHNSIFVGTGDITITDEGLKFYPPQEEQA